MHTLTTVTEVVADIIEKMSEADKATVVKTPEEDLIQFHQGLGTAIRNDYNLWRNQALVKVTGKEHPDDASMVIIKAVWQALCDAGEAQHWLTALLCVAAVQSGCVLSYPLIHAQAHKITDTKCLSVSGWANCCILPQQGVYYER